MHGINDIIKGMAKSCNENPLLNVHNMVIAIPKIKVLGRKTFIKLKPIDTLVRINCFRSQDLIGIHLLGSNIDVFICLSSFFSNIIYFKSFSIIIIDSSCSPIISTDIFFTVVLNLSVYVLTFSKALLSSAIDVNFPTVICGS